MGSLGSSLPVGRMSRFNVKMQDFSSSTYECIGRAFERLLWTLGSGDEGDAMSCWENCWESLWRGSARQRQAGKETDTVWTLCSSSARHARRATAAATTSSSPTRRYAGRGGK